MSNNKIRECESHILSSKPKTTYYIYIILKDDKTKLLFNTFSIFYCNI